jgi:hypothetical protein
MSNIDVCDYLDQLRRVLPCVQPISSEPLRTLHTTQDYKGMVQLIKKAMNIADVTFLVFWVNEDEKQKNKERNPAWILLPVLPDRLPFYGTKEFRETSLKIFFRKSFLRTLAYDQVAIIIAHELSHVVLDSIRHPLFREEEAVDLTAMLLGFRRLYCSAAHTDTGRIGYLTQSEVHIANKHIETFHSDESKTSDPTSRANPKEDRSQAFFTIALLAVGIVFTIAIWFMAIGSIRPVAEAISSVQPNEPILRGNAKGIKATIPNELINTHSLMATKSKSSKAKKVSKTNDHKAK